ncbi:UDP-N-acetylmuramoyl-tripeptide--D-alanyl-D-alanine ligase [Campylobacter sp. RKI_CA19_01121]|uniref:UDP-N-acetylmuramoyl-tripeptide--D-alanyl-D- alanine ligase n=1 Tax=Campylobacter sp. RKI_CA19_01121 TaxID=2911626 RepID=UPI0021E715D3|nr:UDP-N-acetylmuramoyl-tripeptide--D-alanyl-D-alanine ligase [Campylobacter sp. RKI_CA19_01121]MCV3337645.1 UDP-N-acetylmuramoyl-tripeptide--D-alanyl-D-alanine ligase [Campylobacter sp. RKI_CA19_01121]
MISMIAFLSLNFLLGFYLILALQWYSYKFSRIILHFAKPLWHLYFLIIPYFAFVFSLYSGNFYLYFIVFALSLLYGGYLYKNLDKKLVFTARIKRYFLFLSLFTLVFMLFFWIGLEALVAAFLLSFLVEKINQNTFIKKANKKICDNPNLKIILITASFGKTSIKNFLYELLKDEFKCYKTPRSVNTFMGIVKDINENLENNTEIYIVEAGAREQNDILEITEFLNPQICIVGEIGLAHLEYFKTQDNIRSAKLQALKSKRLEKYFLHSSTLYKNEFYDDCLSNVRASLEGLDFKIRLDNNIYDFHANLLGAFNAYNISVCILLAHYLGIKIENIIKSVLNLKAVEHRLQVISKEPKFIIDDGFNGNFKGMSQSYELCKSYQGRKVLVTPGIVEVNEEENIKLCKIINECFDFVIITSEANSTILQKHIILDFYVLKEKSQLVQTLSKLTQNGDLILFSNDAPSFM